MAWNYLVEKGRKVWRKGVDYSQNHPDETSVDGQPLALKPSKVSTDYKKVLGMGSVAFIYRGKFNEEDCAVKVFNSGVIKKEALGDIASIIQHHPNVVLVHGLWYGCPTTYLPNNDPALVMELCDMSLDAFLKGKVDRIEVALFQIVERLDILSDVVSGMTYLHSKEIVHGGLRAQKVFLRFTGPTSDKKIHAKVAGVCEMKLLTPGTLLRHRASVQRSGIMPPEVMAGGGDAELTKAVDLFSFGCLIAHVASCVPPVPSKETGLNEFQKRAQFVTGSRHRHIYEPLMKKCLDEQPEARGTFDDVQKDLSVHHSKHGGKQTHQLEEQIRDVKGRVTETGILKSEVDQPKDWIMLKKSSPEPAAEVYNVELPHHSVTVSSKVLGEGSFAKVYNGQYVGRPCAVKVFKEDILKKVSMPSPADKRHLSLAEMKHTNIVQMYGICYNHHHKTKVETLIVMELCDESLFEAIKMWKSTTDHKQKLLILNGIAKGMTYLHSQNIVHGNLHSGNVLLCHSANTTVAKVADFHMRYHDPGKKSCLTKKFRDKDFFPPEVYVHEDPEEKWSLLTPEVDVFCFGELALEMACRLYPTPEKRGKGHQSELQRRQKYLAKLGQADKKNLVPVIQKCLSDTPEGRPSFRDILMDIERQLHKYGDRTDIARVSDKTVESDALGTQAISMVASQSSGDVLERKVASARKHLLAHEAVSLDTRGHGSHLLVPDQGEESAELRPLALDTSLVMFDRTKVVGRGLLATVYQGMYKESQCAFKVFEHEGVQKFDFEANLQLGSIIQHHPNVVLVHGLWYGGPENILPRNVPALVMELCSTNLQAYLEEIVKRGEDNVFDTATKSGILRDVTAGMIYLHSEQIVHGYLSASNVLLNVNEPEVVAKVADFGRSRLVDPQILRLYTGTHEISDIMPPEVKNSQGPIELTKAVDVFSFGCLILHVAYCHHPGQRSYAPGGTVKSEFEKRAAYISTEETHVFHPVMERCLEENPQARGTFEEVIVHLKKYSGNKPDERGIERQRSQLLQLQRAHENMQRLQATLEEDKKTLEQEAVLVKKQMQTVGDVLKKYAGAKEDMKTLEDKVKQKESDLEQLRQQYSDCAKSRDKYRHDIEYLQSEVDRLSSLLARSEEERIGVMKKWTVVEHQRQNAEKQVSELQSDNHTWKIQSEITEKELKASKSRSQELTVKVKELNIEKDSALKRAEGLQRQLEELHKDHESLRKTSTLALQEKADLCQQLKVALQVEKDKLHSTEESVCQKEKEVEKLKGDLQSERDKVQSMEEAALQKEKELDQCKARKAAVEKDLLRARKMAKDLLDEHVVVNAESEQKMENLNERLMEFKQQAVLSEEHLKQVQGLEGEHQDLKIQLKTLTTTLEDFQKVLTDEQKSRKSLDASVKALTAEIDQLRTELKERDNEVSSLAAANKHLQRKVDAADASSGEMKAEKDEVTQLRTELKERDNEVSSLTAANGGLQRKVVKADADITEMKAKLTSLKKQVKALSTDKKSLEQTLDTAEAAIQKHKNDCEDCQEKLKDAEQQVALFQGKRQQLEVLESVAVELKSRLSGLMMDAPPLLTPSVGGGKDGSSAIALTQEAAQKVLQQLERERDSLKAERHMYQMKWLAAEDMMETVKSDRQSLEDERDSLQRRKETLEEDSKSMMTKIAGLEEQLKVEQDKLQQAQMDAPPSLTPSVGGRKDGSPTVALTQEAAQKVQQLERERDSLKAERHMYQMKWLAAEDVMEAVKSEKQSLERNLELMRQAFQSTRVHLQVTEQSLREEYKKKFSEAYEVMKSLLQEQEEGGARHPPERIKLDALMDICRYYKDERGKEIERAAAEKQCILGSKKETDEKVEAMACKIAALKECIEVRDGEIKRIKAQLVPQKMEAAPEQLPSDVIDVTADESLLQQFCYMATGIKQILVSADGGRFTLGSGDASLEFPPGTVEKETSVRYAIILHGPFVFPAGCKPGSVVIYLNMDGATLLKPVLLYLSHWYIKEKGEDEDTLKFVSASHTLEAVEAVQQAYVFEEEDDADFTRTNVGVLSIRDPHCLFCVKTKGEKVAMYSAIAFSRYIPSEETLLFRIQLMCDSLEWNEKLNTTLQLKNWEKTSDSDVVTRFQYADGQHQITASPTNISGPGWEAAICGQHGVMDQMFLAPCGKTNDEIEREVISGRFPPCILYKIIDRSQEEKRTRPALLKVDLNGANVPLSFSCRIKEEMCEYPTSPVSPAFFSAAISPHTPGRMSASYGPSPATSGQSAERCPSSPQAEISQPADVIGALNHALDVQWREFGIFLHIERDILDSIATNNSNVRDRMLQLVETWLGYDNGTGDLPRTWETVVQAVKNTGPRQLAEQLAQQYGVKLSGQ